MSLSFQIGLGGVLGGDNFTTIDAVRVSLTVKRSITNTIVTADSVSRLVESNVSIHEQHNNTKDLVTAPKTANRSFDDTINTHDTMGTLTHVKRSFIDIVNTHDVVDGLKNTISFALHEHVNTEDSVAPVSRINRLMTDTTQTKDAIRIFANLHDVSLYENVYSGDVLHALTTAYRFLEEATIYLFTEEIIALTTEDGYIIGIEAVYESDGLVVQQTLHRIESEHLPMTDSVSGHVQVVLPLEALEDTTHCQDVLSFRVLRNFSLDDRVQFIWNGAVCQGTIIQLLYGMIDRVVVEVDVCSDYTALPNLNYNRIVFPQNNDVLMRVPALVWY